MGGIGFEIIHCLCLCRENFQSAWSVSLPHKCVCHKKSAASFYWRRSFYICHGYAI